MTENGRELVQTTKLETPKTVNCRNQIVPYEAVETVQGEVVDETPYRAGILYEEWHDRRTFTTTVKLRIRDEFREHGTDAQLRELDELLQRFRCLCA